MLKNCRIIEFPQISNPQGNLVFIEENRHFAFDIKRVYYIYDIPNDGLRGGHAHKQLHELIIPIAGSFDVILDDGYQKKTFSLKSPRHGLYVAPMIWFDIKNFTVGSVCMALASEFFEESDYFRNYNDFLQALKSGTYGYSV